MEIIINFFVYNPHSRVSFPFKVSAYLSRLSKTTPVHTKGFRILSGGQTWDRRTDEMVASVSNSSRVV